MGNWPRRASIHRAEGEAEVEGGQGLGVSSHALFLPSLPAPGPPGLCRSHQAGTKVSEGSGGARQASRRSRQ